MMEEGSFGHLSHGALCSLWVWTPTWSTSQPACLNHLTSPHSHGVASRPPPTVTPCREAHALSPPGPHGDRQPWGAGWMPLLDAVCILTGTHSVLAAAPRLPEPQPSPRRGPQMARSEKHAVMEGGTAWEGSSLGAERHHLVGPCILALLRDVLLLTGILMAKETLGHLQPASAGGVLGRGGCFPPSNQPAFLPLAG